MSEFVRPSAWIMQDFIMSWDPLPQPVWYVCVPILGPANVPPGFLANVPSSVDSWPMFLVLRIPGPGRTPPVCFPLQLPLRSLPRVYVIRSMNKASNKVYVYPQNCESERGRVCKYDGIHCVLVATKNT